MLSGKYARSTQNPAMKHHFMSTGNKRLAEASPLDPVWGIGLRVDDPRAKGPRQWRGKILLGEALSAVHEEFATLRPGWQTRPPLVGSVLPWGMLESTKFRPRHSRARWPRPALAKVLFRSSDLFLGRAGRPKPGSFGDSFWRRPWPCVLRTRPLPRRGYCDAKRRFVHHQICDT